MTGVWRAIALVLATGAAAFTTDARAQSTPPADSAVAAQWASSLARASFVFSATVESAARDGGETTAVVRIRPDTDAVYLRPATTRPMHGARLAIRGIEPSLIGSTVLVFATVAEFNPSPILVARRIVTAPALVNREAANATIAAARRELRRRRIATAVRGSSVVVLGVVESAVIEPRVGRGSGQEYGTQPPWRTIVFRTDRVFAGSVGRRILVTFRADERFRTIPAVGERTLLMLSRRLPDGDGVPFVLRDDSYMAPPSDSVVVLPLLRPRRSR